MFTLLWPNYNHLNTGFDDINNCPIRGTILRQVPVPGLGTCLRLGNHDHFD